MSSYTRSLIGALLLAVLPGTATADSFVAATPEAPSGYGAFFNGLDDRLKEKVADHQGIDLTIRGMAVFDLSDTTTRP